MPELKPLNRLPNLEYRVMLEVPPSASERLEAHVVALRARFFDDGIPYEIGIVRPAAPDQTEVIGIAWNRTDKFNAARDVWNQLKDGFGELLPVRELPGADLFES